MAKSIKHYETERGFMTDHVSRFFEQYERDPALKARVEEAVAC